MSRNKRVELEAWRERGPVTARDHLLGELVRAYVQTNKVIDYTEELILILDNYIIRQRPDEPEVPRRVNPDKDKVSPTEQPPAVTIPWEL